MTTVSKVLIKQDDSNPLWRQIKERFQTEVKAHPDPRTRDTRYYYPVMTGRLKVTDYDWYLINEETIVRERKNLE